MKIIQKILSYVRNADLNNLVSSIISVFSTDLLATDVQLETVINEITTLNNQLSISINKDKALSDLESLDDVRDNDFRAIVALTNGYTHFPTKEIADAALLLQNLNDRYKVDILESGKGAETAYLNSYFTDIEQPDMVAATTVLPGIASLVDALKVSAGNFETSQANLLDIRLSEKGTVAATTLKKELVSLVNTKLISGLRYCQYIADENYTKVCAAVEQLIATENSKTRQRRKSNKNEE